METESQRVARSYLAGALSLLEGMDRPYGGITKAEDLEAPMALLVLAGSRLGGKDDAREKKIAGDRGRRAKAKTKPRPRPRKHTAGAFAAPRAAADVD